MLGLRHKPCTSSFIPGEWPPCLGVPEGMDHDQVLKGAEMAVQASPQEAQRRVGRSLRGKFCFFTRLSSVTPSQALALGTKGDLTETHRGLSSSPPNSLPELQFQGLPSP